MLKIYIIVTSIVIPVGEFILGYCLGKKAVDDDPVPLLILGGLILLWPVTVPLALLTGIALMSAVAGSTVNAEVVKRKEAKLKAKLREEVIVKQKKLTLKLGD